MTAEVVGNIAADVGAAVAFAAAGGMAVAFTGAAVALAVATDGIGWGTARGVGGSAVVFPLARGARTGTGSSTGAGTGTGRSTGAGAGAEMFVAGAAGTGSCTPVS